MAYTWIVYRIFVVTRNAYFIQKTIRLTEKAIFVYKILLISAKFGKGFPTFDSFPFILDTFNINGLPPDFLTVYSLSCGFLSFNLLNTISETLLCSPWCPSCTPCLVSPIWIWKSNWSFPSCFEKAHCDGRPLARFLRMDIIFRTNTEKCRHYQVIMFV